MKTVNIGILGLGTVGGGTYQILDMNRELIEKRIGKSVKVTKVLLRNLERAKTAGLTDDQVTQNPDDILKNPEIDIVVEAMGGIEPATSFMLTAMEHGKGVVTANKAAVAAGFAKLQETAKANNVEFKFEASVGGGIPALTAIQEALAGNEFSEVMGILNGTTNYILTKMTDLGLDYNDVLKDAQDKGFAEADPTADVEGYDAGRKLAIMASIAFHTPVTFDDVYTEGITKITAKDMRYAKELGCTIKLLGIARNTETGIEVKVHPTLIPESHPLASVNDAFNAVFVHGDAVDDAMFYGRGAGSLPTGSAVVGDIMDVARNMLFHANGRIGCSCYKQTPIKGIGDTTSSYYIRMKLEDRAGTLAALAGVFGSSNVSISILLQKAKVDDTAEIVIVTYDVEEKKFRDAMTVLSGMSMVKEICSIIRVYQLGEH